MVVDAAAHAAGALGERALVATTTNEQTFDVAGRLAARYTRIPVTVLVRRGRWVPDGLRAHPHVRVVTDVAAIPTRPSVVVANATKLARSALAPGRFDVLIIDEAYQLPNYRFFPLAALAPRYLQVGDPGQIEPVVGADITRWLDDPTGPHVAAPAALLARYPSLPVVALSVTHRLPPDTVDLLRPAFYPNLTFAAAARAGDRILGFTRPAAFAPLDAALNTLANGASVAAVELPPTDVARRDDAGVAAAAVSAVERLFARGAAVDDGRGTRALAPEDVGVVCPHIVQATAVQALLPDWLRGRVMVDTANRWQGLERAVMVAWHPLAGQSVAKPFALNPGRFCVALSRHRVACLVGGRAGVESLLDRHVGEADLLGVEEEREYAGLRAHHAVMDRLRALDRVAALA
jgi:hypothetical protein